MQEGQPWICISLSHGPGKGVTVLNLNIHLVLYQSKLPLHGIVHGVKEPLSRFGGVSC